MIALEQRPHNGVPEKPGAWWMIAARHRAVDRLRRNIILERKHAELLPSPEVELNRAVAVAMACGPSAGMELVDRLAEETSLQGYSLLPSARGDLLARLGRHAEACTEFQRAAALTRNRREHDLPIERLRSND